MHDYGLAQDIAEEVTAEARRAGARRVTAVEIEVGGLSHSSPERLGFWIGEALKDGPSGEVTVRVVKSSPVLRCSACGRRSQQSPPTDREDDGYEPQVQCPCCGSTLVRLEGDSGCVIRRLELET